MSVYLGGAGDIHDPETYARYREVAGAALQGFDVEIVSVDDHPEMLEGSQPANHLLVVKFPSMERLKAFHASEAYQRIVHHRHAASTTMFLMAMRGLDEPAG